MHNFNLRALSEASSPQRGNRFEFPPQALWRHPKMSGAVYALGDRDRRVAILEIGSDAAATLTWAQSIAEFCPAGGDIVSVAPRSDGPDPMPPSVSLRKAAVLSDLAPESFDIVHLGGARRRDAVLADLNTAARLVRPGGFLCGDGLDLQLHEVDAAFARAHGARVACTDPKTGREYNVGITLAVHEFFGEVTNYGGFFIMRRGDAGFEPVDLSGCPTVIPTHFPPIWQDALRHRAARTGTRR